MQHARSPCVARLWPSALPHVSSLAPTRRCTREPFLETRYEKTRDGVRLVWKGNPIMPRSPLPNDLRPLFGKNKKNKKGKKGKGGGSKSGSGGGGKKGGGGGPDLPGMGEEVDLFGIGGGERRSGQMDAWLEERSLPLIGGTVATLDKEEMARAYPYLAKRQAEGGGGGGGWNPFG